MVKTSLSNIGDVDSIPGWGANIPYTSWSEDENIKKTKKQKLFYNRFNKDFKYGLP